MSFSRNRIIVIKAESVGGIGEATYVHMKVKVRGRSERG